MSRLEEFSVGMIMNGVFKSNVIRKCKMNNTKRMINVENINKFKAKNKTVLIRFDLNIPLTSDLQSVIGYCIIDQLLI